MQELGGVSANFSKLSEVADVIDSLHKTPKYSETGFPMVRCTDVKYGKLDLSDTLKVSDEVFAEFSRRYKPKKNDIIITRVGSYGLTALVDDSNFCLGQNTTAIVPKINPRYLYIALNSPQVKNQIEFSVVGSTQKTLSLKAINDLEIRRFGGDVEDRIAEILSAIDDKGQLNRQINQTLEEMAQAIFKSWFVDFEPVKARIEAKTNGQDPERAAMCAISGKTDAELDHICPDQLVHLRATAALFPDELTDSELGLIPKGWGVSTIGVEFIVTMGQSPPGHTYNKNQEGTPFFQGRRDFKWRYPVNRVFCTAPKRFAQKGDTLLSVRAPVGDVNKAATICCIGRGLAALRHKSGCEAYTYYTLKKLEQYFNNFDTEGTVFGSINQKALKNIKIIHPNAKNLKEFSRLIGGFDQQILNNENQISSLTQLRDTLLPELISGEIAVNVAESVNKEVI
ncbi:restriction endonuclease subunit S [Desulfobacter postgatei]|uniref:Restriction endonuclease S subunit n=1 Tax=Desulfobacter postgatei 2ac9 TaxID=879212 RepID=I5AYA7_9BACT|nr:restriction endonuclease subunit S [Desulfobacter postgatei]EIM62220.1 restriction endonuclease S subunit [Desulfobacter postgatei 2ac9]